MKISTENNEIILEEVFNGICLRSPDGEELTIAMRDGGFEFSYGDQWYRANEGEITCCGTGMKWPEMFVVKMREAKEFKESIVNDEPPCNICNRQEELRMGICMDCGHAIEIIAEGRDLHGHGISAEGETPAATVPEKIKYLIAKGWTPPTHKDYLP